MGQEFSPGEQIQAYEWAKTVRAAIAVLPEDLRIPLVLAEYREWSQAEIAEILGCTAKAVETRVYRAKQLLSPKVGKRLA